MPVIQQLTSQFALNPLLLLVVIPVGFVLTRIFAYFKDYSGLRQYPGPILARFTDAWIFWIVSKNRWADTVDRLHRKHGGFSTFSLHTQHLTPTFAIGIFVRISPNHISISDPRAIHAVYGHSTNFLKSDYYDVFANFASRNIFNTRSRTEHTRKRRFTAHVFAPQSVRAIEPIAGVHTTELVRQWDYLASHVKEVQNGAGLLRGKLGSSDWAVKGGRVWFDCMTCTSK